MTPIHDLMSLRLSMKNERNKITAVKEKIRYKENERNLMRQMVNSMINELKLHNDNIRLYVKKMDKMQEIRLTERFRSSYSPINSKWFICKNSVSYTKWMKWSKFICNGAECKKFWARWMLINDRSDYTKALCSSWIKKCSKWHFDTWVRWKWFCVKDSIR